MTPVSPKWAQSAKPGSSGRTLLPDPHLEAAVFDSFFSALVAALNRR
jgi:hypothetical protein